MNSDDRFNFGIVGDGADAMITAYGSSVAMGVPSEGDQPKAWNCGICTFHNTETLGRFCSLCGSARFGDSNRDTGGGHSRDSLSEHSHSEYGDTLGELFPQSNSSEGSFQFLNLMEDPPLTDVPEKEEPQERRPTLSEKDFQMSFANWSISDAGAWTCVGCTFVNTNALHLTCEICNQSRPSKKTGPECQKVMQEMFETSFRTGQQDFLRRQQEKIEEVEQRVLSSERVQEIMEVQSEMMEDFIDLKKEAKDLSGSSSNGLNMAEKVQLTDEWIDQLEQVGRKEQEEQGNMEELLSKRRRALGMERTPTQRFLEAPAPSSMNLAQSAESEIRAQERLLSQWKQKTKAREPNIAAIRQRQQSIFDKLQGNL